MFATERSRGRTGRNGHLRLLHLAGGQAAAARVDASDAVPVSLEVQECSLPWLQLGCILCWEQEGGHWRTQFVMGLPRCYSRAICSLYCKYADWIRCRTT